jgi:hypothetical protein
LKRPAGDIDHGIGEAVVCSTARIARRRRAVTGGGLVGLTVTGPVDALVLPFYSTGKFMSALKMEVIAYVISLLRGDVAES